MKKNILIFPCGSEIALEVHRSLVGSTYFNVIGANSVDDHGKFVFQDYVGGLPFVTDNNFIPEIKRIVKEYNIDYIYPAMDRVITVLKRAESEIGCYVVSSELRTTEICISKGKTYRLLDGTVRVPRTYEFGAKIDYPVFVKPDIGYGARGAKRIDNPDELITYMESNPDSIISELLVGEEYTVDCFTDRNGILKYWAPRIRSRIANGISVNTYPVDKTEEFKNFVEKINANLAFRGAWFVQVKRNREGDLTLLEIASRLGGSSALFRAKGVNFAQLTLFDAMGYDVQICENDYDVEMDRALDNKFRIDISYDEVFIDFDDCILIDKKYFNLDAIKFIYQCKNRGIKVTLLSRHNGDLWSRISQLDIMSLFDNIIHIKDKSSKAQYIHNASSIFIDDSFAERRDVANVCHIPVFSVDMIPILIH